MYIIKGFDCTNMGAGHTVCKALSLLPELELHRQVVDKRTWEIGSHEYKLELTKTD